MNYNERLVEIMMRKDDKMYRETAQVVRKLKIDVYDFYQKYGMIPKELRFHPNVNTSVMKKSLEQLEKELSDGGKIDLSSLLLTQIISNNLV